jgi:hypothetical protein
MFGIHIPVSLIFCLAIVIGFVPPVCLILFFARTRGLSRKGKFLYAATIFLELPGVGARFVFGGLAAPFILFPVWLVFALIAAITFLVVSVTTRNFQTALPALLGPGVLFQFIGVLLVFLVAFGVSWGPVIWSYLNLIGLRGGYRATAWSLGARTMSEREKEVYLRALAHIRSTAHRNFIAPTHVFVLDGLEERAFTIGTTLYIGRMPLHPAKGGRHLTALLAHELGVINSIDGKLVLALRRLVIPPFYLLSYAMRQIAPGNFSLSFSQGAGGYVFGVTAWVLTIMLALAGGGIGELILYPLWVSYWRESVYRADLWAAECGLAQPLIDYLENHEVFDIAVPYFFTPQPYVELRIDRLMQYQKSRQTRITGTLTPQPVP